LSCTRGDCSTVGDRETHWEFDQPEQFYIEEEETGDIRTQLGVDRIHIRFQSVGYDMVEYDLPPSIHLIWLGSPLPDRYLAGPYSLARLNPEHTIHLWVDRLPDNIQTVDNIRIQDINKEVWTTQDMLDQSTNYAMKTDILRLEIIYKYGGIYVDVDATALRSFGPVFSTSFLCYRPANWTTRDKIFSQIQPKKNKIGSAGIENNIFGFPANSNFLKYALSALRENFPVQTATLYRTGPVFLKEVFLQFPFSHHIPLVSWDYAGGDGEHSVVVDLPGNADWDDQQDIRRIKATVVTINNNNII